MNKALHTVMGKSNLRFAAMSIAVNISIDGLTLLIPTTRQVCLNLLSGLLSLRFPFIFMSYILFCFVFLILTL